MNMEKYSINKLPPRVLLWGGTGQAKAVRPIIEYYGSKIIAVFDDTPGLPSPFADVEIYQGKEAFFDWIAKQPSRDEIGFCIAIGNPHGRIRLRFNEMLSAEGLTPITFAHPTASIAPDAVIGEGSQILAGAIIASEANLGRQCIVNCNALVEHEAILDDAVEIAPAATVLGLTHVGVNTMVGAGATVLSRLRIGADVTVGAGAVVFADVGDGEVVKGATNRAL
jgi:sugar O-acyltransferase (sialic acid O-acetyltransferase NeuD family)